MYEDAEALGSTLTLNQGDVLADAPHLGVGGEANRIRLDGRKNFTWPVPDDSARRFEASVRVVQPVTKAALALVISNSCDNSGGDLPLILAPVGPFDELPDGKPASEAWRLISSAATGTSRPKYFYLPGSPRHGIARSEALLGELYSISHAVLQKYAGLGVTRRVCTLKQAAVRHLQWQIASMFGRNPREDYEWPSDEDLRLKMAWLQEKIADRRDEDGVYAKELRDLRARFAVPES